MLKIGERFGRLIVTADAPGIRRHQLHVWATCDCGVVKIYRLSQLRSEAAKGRPVSCGCGNGDSHRTHGGSETPTYKSWSSMLERINNPNHHAYQQYGGAGLTVFEGWKRYECFLRDMGERPSLLHSIDRIDGAKGYSPENCRWATKKQQSRNMRTNQKMIVDGVERLVVEVAEERGLNADVFRSQTTRKARIAAGLCCDCGKIPPSIGPRGRGLRCLGCKKRHEIAQQKYKASRGLS